MPTDKQRAKILPPPAKQAAIAIIKRKKIMNARLEEITKQM